MPPTDSVSDLNAVRSLIEGLFSESLPVLVELWDGTSFGPPDGPGKIAVKSPDALRRVLFAPSLLGISRAFAAGDLDIEGNLIETLDALLMARPRLPRLDVSTWARLIKSFPSLGVLGLPLSPPPEEGPSRRRRRRSKARDAAAISYHYDVSNEFYELFLGPTMAYTCARFEDEAMSLDDAQRSKFDLVCRKLGLEAGDRLLDVGCGWGGFAMHAAKYYDAKVVGVNVSKEQATWAKQAVEREGLTGKVDIRNQDYRDAIGPHEVFDAVAAIGILEHVGQRNTDQFFSTYASKLKPRGRMLNHAISKTSRDRTNVFTDRYIFPGGELQHPANVVLAMDNAGLEVRDVESLREHYEKTLFYWDANLGQNWESAIQTIGLNKARVWKLYLAGCAVLFRRNRISLYQVLGVKTDAEGVANMPLTRHGFV